MSYMNLLIDAAERVATITVNRPDKLNALDDLTIHELGQAIDALSNDGAVGAVILTGAGRAFIAGADISELASQTPDEAKKRSQFGQAVFRRFETSRKPVIAAVNGFALGGGCELAMACHVRLASEKAKFGQPEVKLGITPGYGGTQRLPRLVGRGRALGLLLTGEMIDAQEAFRIGLANAVFAPDALLPAARAMAATMIANGPLALALCIEALDRGLNGALEDGINLEANHFALCSATSDMREGMQAFLDKRPAVFTGR